MRKIPSIGAALVAAGLGGCAGTPTINSYKPMDGTWDNLKSSREVPALTYTLPVTVIQIAGGPCIGQPAGSECKSSEPDAPYGIAIMSNIKADPSPGTTFVAAFDLADFSTDEQEITVDVDGLLTNSTTTATDQSKQIIVDFAKAVGVIGGGGVVAPRTFSPASSEFDPRQHRLSAFSTHCTLTGEVLKEETSCELEVPYTGRVASIETSVTAEEAPVGIKPGKTIVSQEPCDRSAEGWTCTEIKTQTYNKIDKKVFVETKSEKTYRFSGSGVASIRLKLTDPLSSTASCDVGERSAGLLYRVPSQRRMEVRAVDSKSALDTQHCKVNDKCFVLGDASVSVINPCQTFATVPIRRGFTTTTTALTFADGVATKNDSTLPGQVAQIATTPLDAARGVLTELANFVSLRVKITQQDASAILEETKLLENLKKRVEAEEALEDALSEASSQEEPED